MWSKIKEEGQPTCRVHGKMGERDEVGSGWNILTDSTCLIQTASKLPNEWLDVWHLQKAQFCCFHFNSKVNAGFMKQCKKGNESVWVQGKSPEKSPNAIVPGSKSHPFLRRQQQRGFRAPWPSKHRIGKTNTFRRWSRQRRKHRDFAVCVESPITDAPVSSPATHTHAYTHIHQSSALTYHCTHSRGGGKEEGRGEKSEPTLFESLPVSVTGRMCSVVGGRDRLSTGWEIYLNEREREWSGNLTDQQINNTGALELYSEKRKVTGWVWNWKLLPHSFLFQRKHAL